MNKGIDISCIIKAFNYIYYMRITVVSINMNGFDGNCSDIHFAGLLLVDKSNSSIEIVYAHDNIIELRFINSLRI